MRRTLSLLVLAVVVVGGVFAACHFAVCRWRVVHAVHVEDELVWLRTEFRLTAPELAEVRRLHEGYLPACDAMCVRIAEARKELTVALAGSTNVTPVVEQRLAALAQLRAECQAAMLRHFYTVSRAMPPEAGRRYLTQMQAATLGQPASELAGGHSHDQP